MGLNRKRTPRQRIVVSKGGIPTTRVNHSEYLYGRDPYVQPAREAGESNFAFAERNRRFNQMIGIDTSEFEVVDFTPADDDELGMA